MGSGWGKRGVLNLCDNVSYKASPKKSYKYVNDAIPLAHIVGFSAKWKEFDCYSWNDMIWKRRFSLTFFFSPSYPAITSFALFASRLFFLPSMSSSGGKEERVFWWAKKEKFCSWIQWQFNSENRTILGGSNFSQEMNNYLFPKSYNKVQDSLITLRDSLSHHLLSESNKYLKGKSESKGLITEGILVFLFNKSLVWVVFCRKFNRSWFRFIIYTTKLKLKITVHLPILH